MISESFNVTLLAVMVTVPFTWSPDTTSPGVESVMSPDCFKTVPAGTPVFVPSGKPHADGSAMQFLPPAAEPEAVGVGDADLVGVGVGDAFGVDVGVGLGVGVGVAECESVGIGSPACVGEGVISAPGTVIGMTEPTPEVPPPEVPPVDDPLV